MFFIPGPLGCRAFLDKHVQVVGPGAVVQRALLLRSRHDRQPRKMAQLLVRTRLLLIVSVVCALLFCFFRNIVFPNFSLVLYHEVFILPLQSYWSLSCDRGLLIDCGDKLLGEQQQQQQQQKL